MRTERLDPRAARGLADGRELAGALASLGDGYAPAGGEGAFVERVLCAARQRERQRQGERRNLARLVAGWIRRARASAIARAAFVAACLMVGLWAALAARDARPPAAEETAAAAGAVRLQLVRVDAPRHAADAAIEVRLAGDPRWRRLAARAPGVRRLGRLSGIRTDRWTRAELTLRDGTRLLLNREAQLEGGAEGALALRRGELVAEVRRRSAGRALCIALPTGRAEVLGTKLHLAADRDVALVDVVRGLVRVFDGAERSALVGSGQQAALTRGRRPSLGWAVDLAQTLAWSRDAAPGARGADPGTDEAQPMGLGSLEARRPGRAGESLPLRLAEHRAQVRIHGAVARTQITEVFANPTRHTLEGVYRFPLPANARISRLALDVDGRIEEGTIVDRDRGQKIWRGVLRQATPRALRKREEYIWVPGPWKDPALLQWREGNQFELRIFPIPPRGRRRVILGYTETLPRTARGRRYTYPLPQGASGAIRSELFELRVELAGHDPRLPLHMPHYALRTEVEGAGRAATRRMSFTARDFVPRGDVVIDFATPEVERELQVFTHRPEGEDEGYALFALRPALPPYDARRALAVLVVVDRSYSILGEVARRQAMLLSSLLAELGPTQEVALAACDSRCRTVAAWRRVAAGERAGLVEAVSRIAPGGATDLGEALRFAGQLLAGAPRERRRRVIYVGDGMATVGEREPARLRELVRQQLAPHDARLTTVGVGAAADARALTDLARAGGGAYVAYAPGTSAHGQALQVIARQSGVTLEDLRVEVPAGLREAAPGPERMPVLQQGEELLLAARVLPGVERITGTLRLSGRVNGEPFTARYPLRARVRRGAGNAFVPRLWAQLRLDELAAAGEAEHREEIVALSKRHHLVTRQTSLLVLESQAMRRAFGVAEGTLAAGWTGAAPSDAHHSTGEAEDDRGEGDDAMPTVRGRGAAAGPRTAASGADVAANALAVAPRRIALRAAGGAHHARRSDALDELIDGALGGARSGGGGAAPRERAAETLTRGQIQAGMRAVGQRVADCADGATDEVINVHVLIAPEGRVDRAWVVGPQANTGAARCVIREVRGARFPRFAGEPLAIAYPYLLRGSGGAPPDRLPTVARREASAIAGSMDRSLIGGVIRRRLGAVRRIYERALKASPTLSGRVSLRFTIGSTGRVTDAEVAGVDDLGMRMELADEVRRWRFPASKGGGSTQVVFPLVFKSAGAGLAGEKSGAARTTGAAPARLGTRIPPAPRDDGRRWVRMRRVSYQQAQVVPLRRAALAADRRRVARREQQLAARPDSRDRHRRLVIALSYAGRTARALELVQGWLARAPHDAEALGRAAELLARRGRRQPALRMLGSLVELDADDAALQQRVARAFEAAADPRAACAHWIAAAYADRADAAVQRHAADCRAGFSPRVAESAPRGAVRLSARWRDPTDLDVALIDPRGRRLSWLGTRGRLRWRDGALAAGEELAATWLPAGAYRVELSRGTGRGDAGTAPAGAPVRGWLRVRAPGGVSRRVPFVLDGQRTYVAELRLERRERLVPAP